MYNSYVIVEAIKYNNLKFNKKYLINIMDIILIIFNIFKNMVNLPYTNTVTGHS